MTDKLHTMVSCERCNGTGVDKTLTVDQECKTCNGTGVRTCVD